MRQSITYSYLTMTRLQYLAILKMKPTPCILGNQGQMCCPTLSHKIIQMEPSQGMPQTVMQATMTLNVWVSMMHSGRQLSLLPLQSNVIIFPLIYVQPAITNADTAGTRNTTLASNANQVITCLTMSVQTTVLTVHMQTKLLPVVSLALLNVQCVLGQMRQLNVRSARIPISI